MAEKAPSPGSNNSNRRRESASSSAGKKRESRAGTRKVTSLTAEQLERKRANDREAQRTIRARTKEHIESLEHQVAELSAKGDQVDRVLQRNAALEAEIAHLRQQLAIMTADDERRSSTSSNPASVISSPFNSPPVTDSLSSASSIPPVPNHRMSMSHGAWHSYAPATGPEQQQQQPGGQIAPYAMAADPMAAAAAAAAGSTMHRQPHAHAHGLAYTIPHSAAAAQYPASDVAAAYHGQMYSPREAHQQSQQQAPPPPQQHQQQHVAGMGYDPGFHLPQGPNQSAHAYPHPPPPSSQIQFQWDSRG